MKLVVMEIFVNEAGGHSNVGKYSNSTNDDDTEDNKWQ